MFGRKKSKSSRKSSRSTKATGKRTGRARSPRTSPGPAGDRAVSPWFWRAVSIAVLGFIGVGATVGMERLERHVQDRHGLTTPTVVRVEFVDPPGWLPQRLRERIAQDIVPTGSDFDALSLPQDVYDLAQAHPWIGTIRRVRRVRTPDPRVAQLRVICTFRKPLVRTGPEGDVYLGVQGVRLPDHQVPRWVAPPADNPRLSTPVFFTDRSRIPAGLTAVRVHYPMLTGVATDPPEVGQVWAGDDVEAGLALAAVIQRRPYANQITTIDVSNFAGREDPQRSHLRLWAQAGQSKPTEIRFGRFPVGPGDFEVRTQRKLAYLDQYAADHNGLIAGIHQYLDLRYDQLHLSLR